MEKRLDEYLRRNLLHASSVGVRASAATALDRLKAAKRPPKWMIFALEGILERAIHVSAEMAAHRDEMSPYKRKNPVDAAKTGE